MFKGSLYGQWEAIVTFTVMIVLADKNGEVDMTPEALSAATSIPLEIIRKGIASLEASDPESRTPDEDGRRIVRVSDTRTWGWTITNYEHYRAIRTTEERREYFRQYKRKHRPKRNKSPQCPPVGTESPQIPPIAVSSKQRQEAEESSSSPLERFVEPSHRAAYLAIRAEVQHAQSFDAMLETLVVPISGGAAYAWPIVGQAILEIHSTGGKATPNSIRAFCRKLTQPDAANGKRGTGGAAMWDEAREILRREETSS